MWAMAAEELATDWKLAVHPSWQP